MVGLLYEILIVHVKLHLKHFIPDNFSIFAMLFQQMLIAHFYFC